MLQEAASIDIPEEFTEEELKEFKRVSQESHAAGAKTKCDAAFGRN